jgi:hypothetical protein
MQRTRLATLIEVSANRFGRWVFNPWRRLSLVIISLLFGNFFGIAIASVAGQTADIDIVVSAVLLVGVEAASWWVYRRPRQGDTASSFYLEVINAFKMGIIYSLFVEAFKLGS